MPNMRYTAMNYSLHFQPTPGQREIRRRPNRDFTLHRPCMPLSDTAMEEELPHV